MALILLGLTGIMISPGGTSSPKRAAGVKRDMFDDDDSKGASQRRWNAGGSLALRIKKQETNVTARLLICTSFV